MRTLLTLLIVSLLLPWNAPRPQATHPGWELGPFTRARSGEPVILPDSKPTFLDPVRKQPVHWEALHTFNPAAIVRNGKVMVLYRAEDNTGEMGIGQHTSRLGLAISADGVHFTRRPVPVFFPDNDAQKQREWPGGVEDPRIVQTPDGLYVLTYTQWNRKIFRVGIATSKDLLHWTKYGPAFADAAGGKYDQFAYKSAGIVTQLVDGKLVAAKLHGRYWMYWGEDQIRLATSNDLIHWTPVEDTHGNPVVVLSRRAGHFDSAFPEVGPPPLLTKKGILLIYNGKNAATNGDPSIAAGAYSTGQALFSADNPALLLARAARPFLTPEMPFEKTGQYTAGTTFAEGLVYYKHRWFLYYGCADSRVGVVATGGKLP
ncbi:MAG: glycoside hydrolase family 130 protein [Acidobacteriaceae bacterium]